MAALLSAAVAGDRSAASALLDIFYSELRLMAASQLARERSSHTLQPTALVNEFYLRLIASEPPMVRGREHFLALAAEAMRRILVEHARKRRRRKRGGGRERVELSHVELAVQGKAPEIISLDRVLSRLEAMDPRLAEVVKLRCFAGLTIAEAACALGVSARTVDRDWMVAKAWLKAELAQEMTPDFPAGEPASAAPRELLSQSDPEERLQR
jgi:RNA polymerase sigma factor (TIGR02999 family)